MMQEVPIVVVARVRPFLNQERLHHEDQCISFVKGKPQLILGKNRGFRFDHVFTPAATQEEVYENCVKPLVQCCFDGYNATVFAYGQTGSGKTYTMGTGNTAGLLEQEFGVLPRAISEIFRYIQENSSKTVFKVKVSFIEIYKEEARDLLEFEGARKDLHIREDDKGNTAVTGLREETVHCLEDIMGCLESGAALRHTASTKMNEYSSRSHCIFTIMIEQHQILSTNEETENHQSDTSDADTVIVSKFHFVDLAGSERAHRTGNQGERFRESISINSGLLALGNVISALSETKKKMQHVPYRQSKLTRLLKDSLGGNSRTAMITCLSPCSSDLDENLNSLKYATRAKCIRNKPIINTVIESTRLAHMQNEIQVLKDELLRQRTVPAMSRDSDRSTGSERSKDSEGEIDRWRNMCNAYEEMGHEAAALIKTFHDNDMPPYDIQDRISQWIRNWDSLKSKQRSKPMLPMNNNTHNDNVKRLQTELDKYKNELENDEEIFIEKSKELNRLKDQIKEIEREKQDLEKSIRNFMNSSRQKDKQLFEQQLRIQTFEDQVVEQISKSEKKGNKIPRSAPESRRNPSAQKEDRMLKNFRARSALLISRLEDLDEVSRDMHFSSDEENLDSDHGKKETLKQSKKRRGLGSTFTKEMPSFESTTNLDTDTMSARARRRNRSQPGLGSTFVAPKVPQNRVSTTPSKLPVRKRSDVADSVQTARKTTADTRKKIRDAEFESREAKQKMRELQSNIKQKEEYIKELAASEKEKQELNNQYKEKVKALEKEIERSKKDLYESKGKLDNYEKQGNEKQRLEKDYKRKLKNLETKLGLLQKKQNDSVVVSGFKEKGERKLNDLEGHVERLRNQYDQMSKKLKEESERKTKLEQELSRGEQKIKELELKTEQQQKLLKRKNEEVVAAHKKLRSGSDASAQDDRNELDEKKKNLDLEIERIVKERQEMEELEQVLKKREDIVKKKEILINEKCEIEMKKLRSSQIISKDMMRLSVQIGDVEKALTDARSTSSMMKDRTKFQEDIARLLRKKAELDEQRRNLECRLDDDDVLEPVEERRLAELTEAVDALEMAIEYKNEIIDAKERSLGATFENRGEEIDRLLDNLGELSKDESKALLRKYFERVIELKESERRTFDLKEEIEIELSDRDKVIQELQHCINQTEARAEKRLTEMDREYEKQMQFLMEKINEEEKNLKSQENSRLLEKRIQELEKDLYYHKKTSRELKHKLREVTGSSSVAISDSVTSEKPPLSSRISEKTRPSLDNDEKKTQPNSKTSSNDSHLSRVPSNENFHFPPVQRVSQDEKKSRNEGLKSPKSQKAGYDRHVAPDEQRRLKEIFEARQHSSKSKRDHKSSKSNQPSDSKNTASYRPQEDGDEIGKNPWS